MDTRLALGLATAAVVFTACLGAQNSTRKLRTRPSELAARAGTAVQWRKDVAAALVESEQSGKPVFWYLPTLAGSPMDRKPEIDRYMMSGPFSWPRMIGLLNESYIPVKAPARGALARRYGLRRGAFIEPGYLLLSGDGTELSRLDQITTFHPEWMLAPLYRAVKRSLPPAPPPTAAQKKFQAGVRLFAAGHSDQALAQWQALSLEFPEDPIGWKAAAEAEGHGPFRFGFEVFDPLAEAVGKAATPVRGSRAPVGAYDPRQLRARSLAFLLRMQLANGGWEDSRYDFGGTDSLPNVYVACTALIAEALQEELHRTPLAGDRAAMTKALERAVGYLCDKKRVNLDDRDELVWAHLYRVRFFCRYLEWNREDPVRCAPILAALNGVVAQLYAMQPGSGCWFHEYANPFVCAEVLSALHLAWRVAKVPLDDARIARGLKALERCRGRNGAFSYGYGRGSGGSVEAAAGRMPACELALLRFERSDQDRIVAAVDLAFRHHEQLASVRKYDDHANSHGYGGFFFWFDMLGRTRAIAAIEDAAARATAQARQRRTILEDLPEIDGCFVDSHELGRTYGTAMALLCLAALPEADARPKAAAKPPAPEAGQQKLFPESSKRGSTRLFYWGTTKAQNYSVGHCTVNFGRPSWDPKFEAALSRNPMPRWRLGRNHWTTLDCDVALQFEGVRVPPGHYFVALSREGETFGLVLLDPEIIRARRLDSYQAHLTEGGTFLPLEHSKSDVPTPQLEMKFALVRGDTATWTIDFGAHRLRTSFRMRGVEPVAALPDPGVGLPRSARWILAHAESFELLALKPEGKDPKGFHGWSVLGRAPLASAEDRQPILASIYRAVSAGRKIGRCFSPRHGVRAVVGNRRVDLVLCFECSRFKLYREDGKLAASGALDAKGVGTLNPLFAGHGLSIAR